MNGRVFDIQRFSIHDGPGIRTTVFLQGCPLRCPWCQNPEGIEPAPLLMLYGDLCIGCGACGEVCPVPEEGAPPGRPARCVVCGACVEVCPTGARRIAGREMTVEEAVAQALRDRPFYGDEGGVTLGGGEPLAQWEFAFALARRLREEGTHVALDTACAAPASVLLATPAHFDLIIADLKFAGLEEHYRWTGAENGRVLEALRLWAPRMVGRLWISVPLVVGVHDEAELAAMARFLGRLKPPPPVRLVPYHAIGASKYLALGRKPPEFAGDAEALLATAQRAMHAEGLDLLPQ
jgi:pyruvate formate lyase activating enzyme